MAHKCLLLSLLGISVCFVTGTVASEAIIDGYKAVDKQFPYFVSVQRPENGHGCGGGIIEDQFIITAAHCVVRDDNGEFNTDGLSIVAGIIDLNHNNGNKQVVRVKKVYVPKVYSARLFRAIADIAVLRLEHPLRYSEHVKKLDPPKHESYAGIKAKMAGVGWDWIKHNGTHEDGGHTDYHLRFAEAFIVTKKQCESDYGVEHMPDHFVCARVEQRDNHRTYGTCYGDSGGVLVYNNEAIGILSHAPNGCTERKHPSVYVEISRYMNFIENSMKDIPSPDIRTNNVKH